MAEIVEAVPLTTFFSLPPECSTRWIMPRPGTVYSNIAYVPGEVGSPQITVSNSYYVDCYPYRISNSFSPGVCPSGDSFVACGVTILTSIWWLRRKRRKIPHPNDPELTAHSRGLRIFLKGKWRAEAEGLSQPVETEGRSVIIIPGPPVELEART